MALLHANDGQETKIIITIITAIVFTVVLYTYERTLNPSVPGGDAGELITEAWQFGLPHPPGYPTFSMIGHIFARKLDINPTVASSNKISKVAWRLNFMSAILTSFSAVFLFLMIQNIRYVIINVNKLHGSKKEETFISCFSYFNKEEQSLYPWLIGSIVASITFSFSPLIWTYAVTAEVFALNNFFASLILYLATDFYLLPTTAKGYFGAFMCGFGLTNQHSLVFFVMPLGISVIITIIHRNYMLEKQLIIDEQKSQSKMEKSSQDKTATEELLGEDDVPLAKDIPVAKIFSKQNIQFIILSVIFFLIGLIPYMYMPYATGKPNSWGDATTLLGFFKHLLRQEYGTFLLHPDMIGGEGMLERTKLYLENVVSIQMSDFISNQFLSSYCIILGIFVSLIRGKTSGQIVVVIWLFYLIAFHSLSNLDLSTPLTYGVHERFWMQPNVCVYFFLGIGIVYILMIVQYITNTFLYQPLLFVISYFTGENTKTEQVHRGNAFVRLQQFIISFLIISHLLVTTMQEVYPKMDQSKNNDLDAVFRSTLKTLPRKSVILVRGDHYTNVMRYLHQVENVRPDIDLMSDQLIKARWFVKQEHHYPNVTFPKRRYNEYYFGFSLEEFINANAIKRPVVACSHLVTVHPQKTYTGLFYGMCDILVPTVKLPKFKPWFKKVKRLLPCNVNYTEKLLNYRPDMWEYKLYEKMFEKQQKLAADMIVYAQKTKSPNVKILKKTRTYIHKFLYEQDHGPFNIQSATWKNFAVAWLTPPGALKEYDAVKYGLIALEEYIKDEESKKDPQLGYIINLEKQVRAQAKVMHENNDMNAGRKNRQRHAAA